MSGVPLPLPRSESLQPIGPQHPYARLLASARAAEAELGERVAVFLVERPDGSGRYDQRHYPVAQMLADPECPFAQPGEPWREALQRDTRITHVFVMHRTQPFDAFGIEQTQGLPVCLHTRSAS